MLRPASLLPALAQAFDAPLWSVGSLLQTGACYRALRRLPGRIFHPLEQRVFQDAPRYQYIGRGLRPCAMPGDGVCDMKVIDSWTCSTLVCAASRYSET